jgi:hypothetical protein
MTGGAIRDISVFFSVTVSTRHIRRVLAGEVLYFVALLGMALRARGFNRHRDLQWLMRIGVAV